MTFRTFFIAFLVLALLSDASASVYKARKKTGDYIVEMNIDRNPPVVDKNKLMLTIRDKQGGYVTDAKVLVNYYMPPMPGMPPMNYTAKARLSGKTYVVVMDLIMAGPWNIVVKMTRHGRRSTARFAIDVR